MATDTYRAVQVTSPGKLELVQRELLAPPPDHVRMRIDASAAKPEIIAGGPKREFESSSYRMTSQLR